MGGGEHVFQSFQIKNMSQYQWCFTMSQNSQKERKESPQMCQVLFSALSRIFDKKTSGGEILLLIVHSVFRRLFFSTMISVKIVCGQLLFKNF